MRDTAVGAGTTRIATGFPSVNEQVAGVAYRSLEQASACSASMDLVPRPAFGQVNMRYILKQLGGIAKRITSGDTGIYTACKYSVALKYKTDIDMALQGL